MTSTKSFNTNGTTKIFSSDFEIPSDSHVKVLLNSVEVSNNLYDVINSAIIFKEAPTTGQLLNIIVSTTPEYFELEYTGGDFQGDVSVNGNFSFTGALTSNMSMQTTVPHIDLKDTDSDTSYNVTSIYNDNGNFRLQTRDDNFQYVSNDYMIERNSNGAYQHRFKIGDFNKVTITEGTTIFDTDISVTSPAPTYRMNESDNNTAARIILSGGTTYLQSGEPGQGGVTNTDLTGNIVLAGYNTAKLYSTKVNAGRFTPYNDNETILGDLTHKWQNVYAYNGTFDNLSVGGSTLATQTWVTGLGYATTNYVDTAVAAASGVDGSKLLGTDALSISGNTLSLNKDNGTSETVAVAAQKGTSSVYGGAKYTLNGTTLSIVTI